MAKKAAKKKVARKGVPRVEATDGLVHLSGEERSMLRNIAARATAGGKGVSAFDRAMALQVGEVDFAKASDIQSFAMSFSQARRRGVAKGRKFAYGTSGMMFKTSDKRGAEKYASVLWIMRTK